MNLMVSKNYTAGNIQMLLLHKPNFNCLTPVL